jgi:hypothetical protein
VVKSAKFEVNAGYCGPELKSARPGHLGIRRLPSFAKPVISRRRILNGALVS